MRVKFFIINPPLCKHEGDEMAKILYYYPTDEADLKKLQAIGLGEALIQVSKRFAGTCEALTTAKFIHGFLEPESDILISLIIENPDSNISHALLSAVISDWYELYTRLNGPIGNHLFFINFNILKIFRLIHNWPVDCVLWRCCCQYAYL